METIETLLEQIRLAVSQDVEARLRASLAGRDRDWLIDQIVRLSLGPEVMRLRSELARAQTAAEERAARRARIRAMGLDLEKLKAFLVEHCALDQPDLAARGDLAPGFPPKGTVMIADVHRTASGQQRLTLAKDMVFALLYGEEADGVLFERREREILTVTVPRAKAGSLSFLRAATEMQAHGTWQDPESVSHDDRADNILIQVEFGEVAGEHIGTGLLAALELINNLEINEQILYAQMVNVEQSSLDS